MQPSLLRALQTGFQLYAALTPEARTAIHHRHRKPSSLRKIAEAQGVPPSTLWRALAAYLLYRRFPEIGNYRHLGVSHVSVILGLPPEHQMFFLRKVEHGKWSRQQLMRQIQRHRRQAETENQLTETLPVAYSREATLALHPQSNF